MPKDITALEIFREEKDDFFANHHQSPLTPAQKKTFQGLAYFPENPLTRMTEQLPACRFGPLISEFFQNTLRKEVKPRMYNIQSSGVGCGHD
jgi:hypothetical protein